MNTRLKIASISLFFTSSVFAMDPSHNIQNAFQRDMLNPNLTEELNFGSAHNTWISKTECIADTQPVNMQAILEHDDEVLVLKDTNIDEEFFPYVCEKNPRLTKVTKLDLRYTYVTDKTLSQIAHYFVNLKILKVEESNRTPGLVITDEGLEHISHMRNLTYLQLNQYQFNPNITDKGFSYLTRLERLDRLTINYCNVTDHAAFELRNLPLKKLKIDFDITDKGLHDIAQISSLETLDISNCSLITGVGFHNHCLNKLRHLEYSDCEKLNIEGKMLIQEIENRIAKK